MKGCKHCNGGFLDNRFGQDVECVNGVLIDIDEATEGWQRDLAYPPAPCEACAPCRGSGYRTSGKCSACRGSGWKSGRNESQERLSSWAAP